MTYSIVARDPITGRLGVAVQSRVFAVGTRVPFARAGVGALVMQGTAEPAWGATALAMLAAGRSAEETVEGIIGLAGGGAAGAQFAIVDSSGAAAAFTSSDASPHAGHATVDGVSCQANLMRGPAVWAAMMDAYRRSDSALEDRLLAALHAAESQGGDVRGRQSAAMLVVSRELGVTEAVTDLRVDDHADPIGELQRLLMVKRAHDHLIRTGEAKSLDERVEAALAAVRAAPDDALCQYVAIQYLAAAGRVSEGSELLHRAAAQDWGIVDRLVAYCESVDAEHAHQMRVLLASL